MSSVNSPGFLIRAIFVLNAKKHTVQKITVITRVTKQNVTPAFNLTALITKHSSIPRKPRYRAKIVVVISTGLRVN